MFLSHPTSLLLNFSSSGLPRRNGLKLAEILIGIEIFWLCPLCGIALQK